MMWLFRKREKKIQDAEKQIQHEKAKFHQSANESIRQINKINKVLGNGIVLKIYEATGHKK